MGKFTRITATACPMPAENIDTDQILPARYLKLPRRGEHGKVLFQDCALTQPATSSRIFR